MNRDVAPGEHVVLIGANGSGKSTLLRAVLGLHPHEHGSILVDGAAAADRADWAARRRRVTWIPQRLRTGSFPLLLAELLASSGHPEMTMAAASHLGLMGLQERPLSRLSGGQLQRAFVARAIGGVCAGAGLLLADEPTAALDFDAQELVAAALGELPVTVLVVSHDVRLAAGARRLVEMAGGHLREIR